MKRTLLPLILAVACGSPDKPDTPSTSTTTPAVDADGDGVSADLDCDDDDADVFPGNPEVCDGVDNDCSGTPDDGLTFETWYGDGDADGYGDDGTTASTCDGPPTGFVTQGGDCDDSLASVFPGNPEVCDDLDNDCSGTPDDGLTFDTWYADLDGDGAGDPGTAIDTCDGAPPALIGSAGDCDDTNAAIFTGNPEVCDGLDNDCSGSPDDGIEFLTWYADGDGDGWGDDLGASVSTCDGAPAGYAAGGDCDDSDPTSSPTSVEVCDGADNDCNTAIDDGLTFLSWYEDFDGDGVGIDNGLHIDTCDGAPSPSYSASWGDCDDNDGNNFPGNPEVCDTLDNDCDYVPDNGAPGLNWYPDYDQDGQGDTNGPVVVSCPAVGEHVLNADDCDDSSADIYLGAPLVACDLVDTDCDGRLEDQIVPSNHATIADAMAAALDGDSICLEAGTYFERLIVDKSVDVVGLAGAAATVIDGSLTGFRPVSIENNATATVDGITVTNGTNGGLRTAAGADLTLLNSVIDGNTCTDCTGAGLRVEGGSGFVTVQNTEIRNNIGTRSTSYPDGAGISYEGGVLTVLDSIVADNTVDCNGGSACRGGGINLNRSGVLIERSQIVGNRVENASTGMGGGIANSYFAASTATIRQTLIADNEITGGTYGLGGGISIAIMDLVVDNVIVSGNRAGGSAWGDGGGISVDGASVDLTNVTVTTNFNVNGGQGTGLSLVNATATLLNTTIDGNYSGVGGSEGLYVSGGTTDIQYCNLFNNGANDVSGITNPVGVDGNIAMDPMYTDTNPAATADWNVMPQPSSALINAGDPSLYDPHGNTSDIGAYGGPLGDWLDYLYVLD